MNTLNCIYKLFLLMRKRHFYMQQNENKILQVISIQQSSIYSSNHNVWQLNVDYLFLQLLKNLLLKKVVVFCNILFRPLIFIFPSYGNLTLDDQTKLEQKNKNKNKLELKSPFHSIRISYRLTQNILHKNYIVIENLYQRRD